MMGVGEKKRKIGGSGGLVARLAGKILDVNHENLTREK